MVRRNITGKSTLCALTYHPCQLATSLTCRIPIQTTLLRSKQIHSQEERGKCQETKGINCYCCCRIAEPSDGEKGMNLGTDQRSRPWKGNGASLGCPCARKKSSVEEGVCVRSLPVLAHTWELDGILNLLRKQVFTPVSV